MSANPPIDLERYPLDRPDTQAYAALVTKARADIAATGACVLDGFSPADALPGMVAEVSPHLGKAFYKTKTHNAWLIEDDPSVPADHARNQKQTTTSATLGYDCIPDEFGLNAIYEWAPFRISWQMCLATIPFILMPMRWRQLTCWSMSRALKPVGTLMERNSPSHYCCRNLKKALHSNMRRLFAKPKMTAIQKLVQSWMAARKD